MSRSHLLMSAVAVAALCAAASNAVGQSVTTNESDYPPGATVYISGSDFWALEEVVVEVQRADGTPLHDGHDPWTVPADALGAFDTSWIVCTDVCVGASLEVTAVGQQSGLSASAPFTDAPGVFIELTSQEVLWVDANKCGDEGPQGAWLSFLIHNSSGDGTVLTDVSVTFSGFTNVQESGSAFVPANPPLFVPPTDTVRNFTSIADGDAVPVYYYVDYSEVCNNPQGGGSPYDSFSADYSITVMSNEITDVRNGTVTTDELITASAAGTVNSVTLGPGLFVGQVFEQMVTYEFGNNTNIFFQPAAEADFVEDCLRLIQSEITAVTGNADPALVGQDDRLHFPLADVAGAGGTITVTFYWEVLCVGTEQTVSPWAAARSGNKFKYTAIAENPGMIPDAEIPIEITKSVTPSNLDDDTMGPVTWTVTITNTAPVDVLVSSVTDVQPGCMSVNDPDAPGSDITAANSSSIPLVGATGTLQWVGLALGPLHPSNSYVVPAMGSIDLLYASNVLGCGDGSFTNSAIARVGKVDVGPAEATVVIGNDPPVCDAGGPYEAECNGTMTMIMLDGSASFDPDGTPLTYFWTTDCPGASFDDATAEMPTLTLNGSCDLMCTVTLTVSDGENEVMCDATVLVTDDTPPMITCPPDANLEWVTGLDTSPATTGTATATDACDPNLTVTFNDVTTPGSCAGNFTIERTWTATDECGNIAVCVQTINVSDTTPPSITCPPDADLEWVTGLDTSPAATGAATATDACDPNPTVTFNDATIPGSCAGNFTIQRTWTATDECGNGIMCIQTINVSDTTPPSITCPPDEYLEWVTGLDTSPAVTGVATATDACDPSPAVTFDDLTLPGSCAGNFTIQRTWTATDECGNSAMCVQTINVSDSTPPSITCPPDADLEWVTGLNTSPAATGTATASDACDPNPTVMFNDATIPGSCAGNFTIQRTWTATDECGNSAMCVQTINVSDTTPPTVTCPPDAYLEWVTGLDTSPAATGAATATDACDPNPTVTFNDVTTPGSCAGNFTIQRTWTATDECGNSAMCVQTINVSDSTPPTITCPPDAYLEWVTGLDTSPAVTGTATATDACDPNPTVSFNDVTIPGSCAGNFTIQRTWTATDECGNSSMCVQSINVSDSTPPSITCPPNANLEWVTGLDTSPAATGTATATDACDPNPTVTFNDVTTPGSCAGNFTIQRTWSATDECGNSSMCVQSINVSDSTPPSITCPPDANLEWVTGLDTSPAATGAATASDACDPNPTVTFNDVTTPGSCAGNFTIQRTWTATDECGNSSMCVQSINVADTTPPTVTCPPDADLEWVTGLDTSPAATGTATATDACDPNPTVSFNDVTIPGSCAGNFTIQRTWTATDECGNSAMCLQTINVSDSTPPTITCPPDADLEWVPGLDTSPAATGTATATDACDPNPTVSFNDVTIPGSCAGNFTIQRTWTATDECGNSAMCLQTINVSDSTPPTITCPPNANLEWVTGLDTSPAATGTATATDACDPNPVVTFNDITIPGSCAGNFTIQRTWTATDECGNSSMCVQTINVTDTTAPTITCPPDADLEWVTGLDTSPAATGTATATDACDPNPFVTFNDVTVPGSCAGNFTIQRTWTAIDECGNSSMCVQTITVGDTTPPVITCPPDTEREWVTGLDTSPATTGSASATDACDPNPTVTFNDVTVPGSCAGNFTIQRTWTATDECGNSAMCVQVIDVSDTTPPVITCPPDTEREWVTGLDTSPATTGSASATDACDPNPTVTFNDITIPGSCAGNFTIQRTWTATDECGNSSMCLQTINVTDTTAPTITCPPDADLEWVPGLDTSPAATGTATATDACDPNPIVTFNDVTIPGSCAGNFTIQRTWTATDACGNSSMCVQTINVSDTTAPTITCPPDADLEWVTGLDTSPAATGTATATDACDPNPVVTFNDVTVPGSCAGNFTIQRTWTATDECGNSSMCVQTISVSDTTAPVISGVPGDVTVECVENVLPPANVTCFDDCDPNVTAQFSSTTTGTCPTIIVRTWTCIDECGNEASDSQVITVDDTTPPTLIGVPDDLELTCGDPVPPPVVVQCEDNCIGCPNVAAFMEEIVGDCPQTITRTWTCTDACGNQASAQQVITLVGIPGACCLPDGSCVFVAASICEAMGGDFVLEDITCTPMMLGDPGTYLLGNHPNTSQAPPPYGLRLDDLFEVPPTYSKVFTFNFEHPGAIMLLHFDGSSIRIFGVAYGGRDIGDIYSPNMRSYVAIDFTYDQVETVPGDDDLYVVTPNAFNSGTLTWLETGEVIDLYDKLNDEGFTFRLGDEDDDAGHEGWPGISGWGWLTTYDPDHTGPVADWKFTADDLCSDPFDPLGRCCFEDDSCLLLTEIPCDLAGGVFGPAGVTCENEPCGEPLGACCLDFLTGGCFEDFTESECLDVNGYWLGEDSTCAQGCLCSSCPATAWLDPDHIDDWPYAPESPFDSMFENAFPGMTLHDVLATPGPGMAALGREAVTALLNASHPEMSYPMTAPDVVQMFDETVPGRTNSDYKATELYFRAMNDEGTCTLLEHDPGDAIGGGPAPAGGLTPQALIEALGATDHEGDLDGDGIVTPLDLLELVEGENGG